MSQSDIQSPTTVQHLSSADNLATVGSPQITHCVSSADNSSIESFTTVYSTTTINNHTTGTANVDNQTTATNIVNSHADVRQSLCGVQSSAANVQIHTAVKAVESLTSNTQDPCSNAQNSKSSTSVDGSAINVPTTRTVIQCFTSNESLFTDIKVPSVATSTDDNISAYHGVTSLIEDTISNAQTPTNVSTMPTHMGKVYS